MEVGKKEPSVQDMFEFLTRKDGRGDTYDRLFAAKMANDPSPLSRSRSRWNVMKEMGYVTGQAKAVRRRYLDATAQEKFIERQTEVVEAAKVMENDLELAVSQIPNLPGVASPSMEMEWVGGHPAMMRKALQADPDILVRILPSDVLHAPNGLPPSRRAVTTLVNWVNRPQKYHDQTITAHKKADFVGTDIATKDEDDDLSLQEVRELIKQFASGKRPDWS